MKVFWLSRTPLDVPTLDTWLGPNERSIESSLRFEKRRREWRLGRWTAKCALGALERADGRVLLDASSPSQPSPSSFSQPSPSSFSPPPLSGGMGREMDPSELATVELLPAEDGAPEFRRSRVRLPIVVSISHREGLAVCTLSLAATAIGCDLELVEPRSRPFVEDFFTEAERRTIDAWPAATRDVHVAALWSAKESALKALRVGLRRDTRTVEVKMGVEVEIEISGEAATGQREDESGWSPLTVTDLMTGEDLHGFWRRQADHVMTLISRPAPAVPVELEGRDLTSSTRPKG